MSISTHIDNLTYDITTSLIVEILLWAGSAILTTSSSVLLSNVLTRSFHVLSTSKTLNAIVLGSLGFTGVTYLFYRYKVNRPRYPSIDFKYKLLEQEIKYEYKSKNHMIYSRRYKLKSNKKNLNTYEDKYHWTGKGEVNIQSRTEGHRVRKLGKRNVWNFFEIVFPRHLNKNEEVESIVEWDCYDEEGVAVPFFSTTIEEPTEKLIMHLELPRNLEVDEVVCEISSRIGAKEPFETFTKEMKGGEMIWEVEMPSLLHTYEVRWNFPNNL